MVNRCLNGQPQLFCLCSLLVLFFTLHAMPAMAVEGGRGEAARLIMAAGTVEKQISGPKWQTALQGEALSVGDLIRTGTDGRAALLLADETIIRLNHDTLFVLQKVRNEDQGIAPASVSSTPDRQGTTLKLFKGEMWLLNKDPKADVDIRTNSMTASLRGTELLVRVDPDDTSLVSMLEGQLRVWNELGEVMVAANEEAMVRPGSAPIKRILLNPEDAVQWTLLIPQELLDDIVPDESSGLPMDDLRQARQALLTGRPLASRDILARLTARYPTWATAWEMYALAALVTNDKDNALSAAQTAVHLRPDAAYPQILLSSARQARFELNEAEAAARSALVAESGNITAQVQLARILFGRGATEDALQITEAAAQQAPGNAEVHNLLGFLRLALGRSAASAASFAQAIAADPALAEPHLGLGLLAMRRGDEVQAMAEVSSAVLLEPRRALLRSYWAKMLYQLGRYQKALDVLSVSRHIDPHDPTPDLYRALVCRDLRRPGEAIAALNEAMAKNDNRAVYRSRFLLDQDAAVKNIDLSLIYSQLGLETIARRKAAASLYDDYTNSSAHLFAAGSLAQADGRSWARNTENLLARLLMPSNVNTFNSFNDYTAFFERPSATLDYTVTVGNRHTLEQQAMTYGALPKAGLTWSLGTMPSRTAGWREDFAERSRNEVTFLKLDPVPRHGFMFSAVRSDSMQQGAGTGRFAEDTAREYRDELNYEITRAEVGYAFHLRPGTEILLHSSSGRETTEVQDVSCLLPGNTCTPDFRLEEFNQSALFQSFQQVQGEAIHRWGPHQIIVGAEFYEQHGWSEDQLAFELALEELPSPLSLILPKSHFDRGQRHASFWLHDIWRLSDSLSLEAAVYADTMRRAALHSAATQDQSEINPRLGLIWTTSKEQSFRLAAFRTLLPFYGDHLAPADVAGVAVHRNGMAGAVSEEADLIWERETSFGLLSAGLFALERENSAIKSDGAERVAVSRILGGNADWDLLLGDRTGLSFGYRYDTVTNQQDPSLDRDEHLARAGLRWVQEAGLTVGVFETFRYSDFQEVDQEDEDIFLTDLAMEYAFPRKVGFVKLELNNLFNRSFNWVVDDFVLDGRRPGREARLTLNLIY